MVFEHRMQQMTTKPFSFLVLGLIARSTTFPARNKHYDLNYEEHYFYEHTLLFFSP